MALKPRQLEWRGPPKFTHEKQSNLPPNRWRKEWQEKRYRVSKTILTSNTIEPTPIPNPFSKKKLRTASYQRNERKKNARYMKDRSAVLRKKGNLVTPPERPTGF